MDNDDDAIMKDVASAAATAAAAAPPGHNKDDDNDMPSLLAKEGGGADETAAAAVAEDSTAPLAGIDNLQLQDSKSQSKEDDDDEEVIQDSDDDELPPLEGRGGDKAAASGGKDDDDEASTSSTMDEKEESDMKDSIITPNVQQTDDDYLCQATIFKEEGNELFKKGEMDDAARKYRKGMNRLQKIKSPLRQGQEQVQSLKLNLCTNLCMVYSKQNKHRAAVEIATRALKMDSTHVKGLYRRAVAYRQLGDLDSCRDDLKLLLTIDANNKEAKREYALVKRDLAQTREAQKKQLAKAFSRSSSGGNGGAGLYDDKEELERRREAESKRKQQEQEEYAKKRKLQWEDECVSRMAKNEPAISFDEWEKEQEEKTKLAEKEKKAEEKRLRAERKKAQAEVKAAAGGDDSDDDSDKLTESELASLRGYKRTKDGRVTSYFTRELSDAERLQIGDIAPKKLDPIACNDDENNNDNASSSPASTSAAPAAASLRSAWNQAGTTWEEKDCTKWCMDQLRTRLQETTITSRFLDADITKVDDLTGEASMAVVQSKKRYIFDFHATCDYEMADLSDGTVVAKGKVRLPDICTTHEHDEYDVLFDAWTQAPPAGSELEEKALETRKVLADGLRTNIKKWLQDFNEQY